MAVGELHKPVEHKLTADEAGMRPNTVALPGSRLDMSAHPTDFKWSDGVKGGPGSGPHPGGGNADEKKPSKQRIISIKDPATMTAGQVNKELDALDSWSSDITDRLIAAGRGNEMYSETYKKDDELSKEFRSVNDRHRALRNEIELRYGPKAPSRMPAGFKPRKKD